MGFLIPYLSLAIFERGYDIYRDVSTQKTIIKKYEENGYDVNKKYSYRLFYEVFELVTSRYLPTGEKINYDNKLQEIGLGDEKFKRIMCEIIPFFQLYPLYCDIQRILGNYTTYERVHDLCIEKCLEPFVIQSLTDEEQNQTYLKLNEEKMQYLRDYKESLDELANSYLNKKFDDTDIIKADSYEELETIELELELKRVKLEQEIIKRKKLVLENKKKV